MFAGGHESVKHAIGEYVRKHSDVHSNTIESVFSLLKRGIMGTFHSVSRKHLPNYLGEFEFRWNTRKLSDGQRVARAIRQVDGKRLQYRESVDNPPYFVPSSPKQADAPLRARPMAFLELLPASARAWGVRFDASESNLRRFDDVVNRFAGWDSEREPCFARYVRDRKITVVMMSIPMITSNDCLAGNSVIICASNS